MSGSSVPEAARAAAIGAVERQVRYVKAIRWTDAAGNWDVEFAADRLMALADAEVAAAVAEERATTGRAAFIAGAEWADDACPVHAYPKLLEAEADKRYPRAALASPLNETEGLRTKVREDRSADPHTPGEGG